MIYYPTVLGYKNNSIIHTYSEKFYKKLLAIVLHLGIKNRYLNLDISSQDFKKFILHPDISSLILNSQVDSSYIKLLQEIDYYCSQESHTKLSMNQGNYIKNTQIRLTLKDNNPDNQIIGHPDHDNDGMLGWGEKTPEEWNVVFSSSLLLLKNIDEDFYEEINRNIKKVVPLKTSLDVHNSCSYNNCIGTLYLGYTINSKFPELNILEALIHESSHNKLNLIKHVDFIHRNDFSLKYYSPYRPDARHIQGVLLGVHAIIPTVYVMLQGIERGYIMDKYWHEKIILYHVKNKLGYNVVKKYLFATEEGKKILRDLEGVMALCRKKIQELGLSKTVNMSLIQSKAKNHFLQVKKNYPQIHY